MATPRVSIAPLVDITTRHFRYLLRLVSRRVVLHTPMLAARKVAASSSPSILRFHADEVDSGGLVAQIGGDSVSTVVRAAQKCEAVGYSAINLNLGCPAKSAQGGSFGATLMLPDKRRRLLRIVKALNEEVDIPVSCKVRIGVDEHDRYLLGACRTLGVVLTAVRFRLSRQL